MAGTTGLEPATSDVTGRRSNQLNYVPARARLTPPIYHSPSDFEILRSSIINRNKNAANRVY